jgi:hypothetical protein
VILYDGPPMCRDCGGWLGSTGEVCLCGGVSQYRSVQRADPAPEEDRAAGRRTLTWEEAMAQLWERYVPR